MALTLGSAGCVQYTTMKFFRDEYRKHLNKKPAQKAESYKACYDESCQIEIGKEVAAQESLATKLSRQAKKCIVSITLFDLHKSITEDSVNERGGCSSDELTEMFEKLVPQLAMGHESLTTI